MNITKLIEYRSTLGDIYVTSDEHFEHDNIIRFCNRPFDNIDDMNDGIINNFNSVVNNNDTVIHLGDFLWKGDFRKFIKQFNGYHFFIKGNHESFQGKLEGKNYRIFEDSIIEFEYDKRYYVCCHYPMREWNRKYHGSFHLHGHSHGNSEIVEKSFDVGVDTNNYFPYNLNFVR